MVDKSYYVSTGNSDVLGPFGALDLPEKVVSGEIPKSAVVCEVGLQEWQPIRDVLPDWVTKPNEVIQPPRRTQNHYVMRVDPAAAMLYATQVKSVALTAFLGFFIPGGGYWISGNYLSAILSLIVLTLLWGFALVLWVVLPFVALIHFALMLEAVIRVKRHNANLFKRFGLPPI